MSGLDEFIDSIFLVCIFAVVAFVLSVVFCLALILVCTGLGAAKTRMMTLISRLTTRKAHEA